VVASFGIGASGGLLGNLLVPGLGLLIGRLAALAAGWALGLASPRLRLRVDAGKLRPQDWAVWVGAQVPTPERG
jgi:hypothetical protein